LHKLNVTLSKYFDILPSLTTSHDTSNNFINNPDFNQIQSMQGFEVEEDDIYTRREKEENVLADERTMIHSDITSSRPLL